MTILESSVEDNDDADYVEKAKIDDESDSDRCDSRSIVQALHVHVIDYRPQTVGYSIAIPMGTIPLEEFPMGNIIQAQVEERG